MGRGEGGSAMFAQFTANPMRLNWIKALFWCWAVLAILWVLASGWHAYTTMYLNLPFQPQSDCWGPIAKWPDGKPFDEWDRYGAVELDVPSNVEINKKNGEWAADAIVERNRWRETIWQKVKDQPPGAKQSFVLWACRTTPVPNSHCRLLKRKAFECEGRMAAAEKPKMNTYQTVSVW